MLQDFKKEIQTLLNFMLMRDYTLTYEDNQQDETIFNVLGENIRGTVTLLKSLLIVAKKLLMF